MTQPPLIYVESDLSDGQTLLEWRRTRREPVSPRFSLRRLSFSRR